MNKSVLIIANPCSGKSKGAKVAPKVQKKLISEGYETQLMFTRSHGDAVTLAKSATQDIVVCIGGDGTLNETITGLVESGSKSSLGYIPLGSTNDFAKSMGIPRRWKNALKEILEGSEQEIDVCKFNEKYFAYVAAYGIFAETSCSVSQKIKNKIGRMAYVLFGAREVFSGKSYHICMDVEGKRIDDTYAFVGFGNTRSIGGLLKFRDSVVQMADGLFEVILVKYPKSVGQLTRMVKKFYKSDWQGDGLELYHTKEVKVYNQESMLWSLDGEKNILTTDAEVLILPKAIKIIIKE